MERDESLIRRILLDLYLHPGKSISEMPGAPRDDYLFNAKIIIEERLALGVWQKDHTTPGNRANSVILRELTPVGKRFAESIKADES